MTTEGADQRYLLAREMGMWQAEAERTQNRLDDLQPGDSEAAIEQGWYDCCFRKHERVAWEERVRLTSLATGSPKRTST
jgi:hypothetical protein